MKKNSFKVLYLLWILLLMLGNTVTRGQSYQWEQVYTGTSSLIQDMSFVPDNFWQTGWVLASDGSAYKTTDGGNSWTVQATGVGSVSTGIWFFDENTGLVVSNAGKINRTTDGGDTWTTVFSDASYWFSDIAFKDSLNGIICGDPSIYTTDGGLTWNDGTGIAALSYVVHAEGDTYYGAEILSGRVGKTTDGGQNWTQIYTISQLLTFIEFYDANTGFSGGSNLTYEETTDGGTSWTSHNIGSTGDLLSASYFDEDTIWMGCSSTYGIQKSTDGGTTWTMDTSFASHHIRNIFATPTNVVFATGDPFGPQKIYRRIGPAPLIPDFEANTTVICAGSTVDFTDLSFGQNVSSWSWTFEGGSPSTSTDQNPSVTYSSGGSFDVTLTVTDDNGTETLTMYNYITVNEIPAQADIPTGDTVLCTGGFYTFSIDELPYATSYEWEISTTEAGTFTTDANQATLSVSDTWYGDFTLRIRASNDCGDGDWSDFLECTVYESPEEFILEGGGSFCEGGDGVELTLSGSQTGITYELYLDGVATGIIVEGTGSEISFGLVDIGGYYTAFGSNDNCIVPMSDQIYVEELSLPEPPTSPTGPVTICQETSSDYSSGGGEGANSYVWTLAPDEAGTITSTDLEATVQWNENFSGPATISLYGVNDCGEGEQAPALTVNVGEPNPQISGEDLVCDWSEEVYEVVANDSSTYTWEITGGLIAEGQGTNMVTISWQGEGNGTLSVTETTIDGCEGSSDVFEITVDNCTAISEYGSEDILIHPNPANNQVTVSSGTTIENLVLFSVTGNTLRRLSQGGKQIRLNITDLDPGIYFIRISTGNQVITKKIMVE